MNKKEFESESIKKGDVLLASSSYVPLGNQKEVWAYAGEYDPIDSAEHWYIKDWYRHTCVPGSTFEINKGFVLNYVPCLNDSGFDDATPQKIQQNYDTTVLIKRLMTAEEMKASARKNKEQTIHGAGTREKFEQNGKIEEDDLIIVSNTFPFLQQIIGMYMPEGYDYYRIAPAVVLRSDGRYEDQIISSPMTLQRSYKETFQSSLLLKAKNLADFMKKSRDIKMK